MESVSRWRPCWHLGVQVLFFPKICILLHQAWSALRGDQLCWETERKRGDELQEIAHSEEKHSLLFSHTFHRAVITEQVLPDVGQWISAMGFQIGDVWGRVARVQRTWPSGGVFSSAFLPSALKAVKRTAKQTQKQMISEYDFTSPMELTLWLFYHN